MENDTVMVASMPASTAPHHGPAPQETRAPRVLRAGRAIRRFIGRNGAVEATYRIVVGIIGGALAVGGLVLVPLPGPGWLVVFAGLAVLGTEFGWARRAAGWLKRQLARFWAWWKARKAARAAAPAQG